MRKDFAAALEGSGYLHALLPVDEGLSAEARQLQKAVVSRRELAGEPLPDMWRTSGTGRVEHIDGAWRLTAPARRENPEGLAHYSPYTDFNAALTFGGENWEGFNRLTMKLRPLCPGLHAPHISLHIKNDGAVKVPDEYDREGAHVLSLNNREWNRCVWEFPDLPRDCVTELAFSVTGYGTERLAAEELVFEISGLALERVEIPDISHGWQGLKGSFSYSTTGYWQNGEKTAVAHGLTGNFTLEDAQTGNACFTGSLRPVNNEKGSFGIADFSAFERAGEFRLVCGGACTGAFRVSEHPMDEAAWRALNFIYAERCGCPVGRGHSSCHADLVAEHGGKRLVFNGGWHDAGDLSQQTVQTGETVQALLELAQKVRQSDAALYRRLLEEACWGLDFVLKTRFGDGYRAFSAGCNRWTDGLLGSLDEEPVRCHNRSIDNWLLSGVQAYAAMCLEREDPELAWVALRAAREDYGFAEKRFAAAGAEPGEVMEHTHNASPSQFYAAASWAASMLAAATGEEGYRRKAARYGRLLLNCQDTGGTGLGISGFFYRDEGKSQIVHFNHQAREHLFAQALAALCKNQPQGEAASLWQDAAKRYAGYLKALAAYGEPYGMLPAGLHHISEAEDREAFNLLHVYCGYEENAGHYRNQLAEGIQLGGGYCVRQFPVWFSFRGNTAVLLSAAKSAAICAGLSGDGALLGIAREQAYWVLGKNPFGQSLLYGEGRNYAAQYAALCGKTAGQLPVGIQTRADEDVPYWPCGCNATYKEIWMSCASHWMRLLASLY